MASTSRLAMGAGLIGSYGTFGVIAGRYLYPANTGDLTWQFVAHTADVPPGSSLTYEAPSGSKVVITHLKDGPAGGEYSALSSVCPHLGCQVHWEGH